MARLTPPRQPEEVDDCNSFDCGRESMNQWFRRHAWRKPANRRVAKHGHMRRRNRNDRRVRHTQHGTYRARVFAKGVATEQTGEYSDLLLGQLAVDTRFQGMGIGRSLMFYALKTAAGVAREIGCYGVLTHPLDDEVRSFYQGFGFEELPYDPRRSMIVRIKDLVRNGFDAE